MKRKMIGAAAAYMAGLFFASFFTSPVLLTGFCVVMAAALAVTRRYGFRKGDYVLVGAVFAAAVMAFSAYTALRYAPAVSMDGREGNFCGEVTQVHRGSGDNASYILKGSINGDTKAKVSWYSDCGADIGDRISIEKCTFELPDKDYLFDSERYYRSDGVFLVIDSAEGVSTERIGSIKKLLYDYRERIIYDFREKLGGDSGDLLAGMVFGEKRGMDRNVKTAVYRCGIGHVLAVSGLHVSVAVLFLMGLLSLFGVNRYISFAVMELLLLFLTAMAQYPVSAVRAAIMMNFLFAARLFRRQNDSFNSLAGAVLLICVMQPYSIYDEGFLLSVAGTFGISVFAPFMTRNISGDTFFQKLLLSGAVMLCTNLCVFPLSLMYFEETSLISPVMNVFIVPLCSASMVIGLIYALTGGAVDVLFLSKAIDDFVLKVSDIASRSRFTHFSCDSRALIGGVIVCSAAVVLAASLFRNRKIICVTVSAALVYMFVGAGVIRLQCSRDTVVAVLGRGSNAAVVISADGCTDIVDISGHYKSAQYVRKYLSRNGIDSVHTAVLTKKVQSSYAGYLTELEYVDTDSWLAAGEKYASVTGTELSYMGGEFTVAEKGYTIEYSGGAVTVRSGDAEVVFISSDTASEADGGLTVFCGRVPKNAERNADDCIYLDEGNNFEIVLSDTGSFDIRRL